MKTCSTCHKELSLDAFYPKCNQCKVCRRATYDKRRQRLKAAGFCSRCGKPSGNPTRNVCDACWSYAKQWYRSKHPKSEQQKIIEATPAGTKYCSSCKMYLPTVEFYEWDRRKISRCRKCKRTSVDFYYSKLKEAKQCFGCKKALEVGEKCLCTECKALARDRYHTNGNQNRETSRQRKKADKLAAFSAYGGAVCKCCGENHIEFLSIDHVYNDGAKQRRELGKNKIAHFYVWLKQNGYPPGYQVLCMNCNFAKGHFGACPHEQERDRIAGSKVGDTNGRTETSN